MHQEIYKRSLRTGLPATNGVGAVAVKIRQIRSTLLKLK